MSRVAMKYLTVVPQGKSVVHFTWSDLHRAGNIKPMKGEKILTERKTFILKSKIIYSLKSYTLFIWLLFIITKIIREKRAKCTLKQCT